MTDKRVAELMNQVHDLIDKQDWEWVLAVFDELAELRPYDHKVFYNRAIALTRIGRLDPAVKDLERALEIEPEYKLARQALAKVEEAIIS